MPDAAAGRRLLRAAGFRVSKRRIFEANALFDTANHALRKTGRLLRIREAGRACILTYKGPPKAGKHKDREELEVYASDARRLAEILARLDFQPGPRYEKYRTEYQRSGETGVATLDETPIGCYLELEGPPTWIDRTARRLGFAESSYITASYYDLYLDYCRQRGIQPGDMKWHPVAD